MTSIEFLEQNFTLNISVYDWLLLIQQAKEMHRQEIIRAFIDGEENVWDRKNEGHQFQFDNHEHYYNETFKKDI
jgi:hypothetical protein